MAGFLHIELESWNLKYGSISFADWLWSVISPALMLKTISDVLDTNSTHTGIAYAHRTCTRHL